MFYVFTDFGWQGPYVGQLKAALYEACPGAPPAVVDLMHDVPAHDVKAAAYLLPAVTAVCRPDAVIIAVVDPGVGSDRLATVVEADGRAFVGPDNGLFELVARRAADTRFWRITWRPEALSDSFHGRDLFAPVAARIAQEGCQALHGDGILEPLDGLKACDWPDDALEVVYIDSFGNVMLGARASLFDRSSRFEAGGCLVSYARTFSEAPAGQAFWYENSQGLVEIAVNQDRADDVLNLSIGERIRCPGKQSVTWHT